MLKGTCTPRYADVYATRSVFPGHSSAPPVGLTMSSAERMAKADDVALREPSARHMALAAPAL